MPPARVLVAGCGDVGTALALRLTGDGATVFGLRRDPGALPDPIVPVAADLTDAATLRDLPGDLEAVVFAATADEREPDPYRRLYVDGVEHLLAAVGSTPRRFVFVSSTAVYGQTDGSEVDEDSPTVPTRFTGRTMLEAEAAARAADMATSVVRLAGIYGPGRERLLSQVRAGEASCHEEPTYTNRIHRDDAAGAIAHVLELDDPASTYVGVDHDPAERCTVLRWLAARLDAPEPPVTPGASRRGANKRCRNDRLVASGYRFRYPTFREGYAAILDA